VGLGGGIRGGGGNRSVDCVVTEMKNLIICVVLTSVFWGIFLIITQLDLHTVRSGLAASSATVEDLRSRLDPLQQAATRDRLVEWTYRNSRHVSRETVIAIVDETLKTRYPLLFLALIYAESEFNPSAVSRVNAIGLGQIRFEIHKKELATVGVKEARDLFDVSKNIKATELIFLGMLQRNKGDVIKTLTSYVGGTVPNYQSKILKYFVELSMMIKKEN